MSYYSIKSAYKRFRIVNTTVGDLINNIVVWLFETLSLVLSLANAAFYNLWFGPLSLTISQILVLVTAGFVLWTLVYVIPHSEKPLLRWLSIPAFLILALFIIVTAFRWIWLFTAWVMTSV